MVIYRFIYTRNYDIYYDPLDAFVLYLGLLVLSLVVGFVMTLTIEVPFSNLLKMFMEKGRVNERPLKVSEEKSLLTEENL